MEHIILFAICTVIIRLGLPFASTTDGSPPVENLIGAALSASLSAALALPLWAAFEIIYWIGP